MAAWRCLTTTATGTTNVTVNQALVKPGLVLFNNSYLIYSVTSSSGNVIGGSGSVSVSGGGKVTLTGPNTYSGGTTLAAGQLNLNYGGSSSANSAIGIGPLTISGGELTTPVPAMSRWLRPSRKTGMATSPTSARFIISISAAAR